MLFFQLAQMAGHEIASAEIADDATRVASTDDRQSADVVAQHFDRRFMENLIGKGHHQIATARHSHGAVVMAVLLEGVDDVAAQDLLVDLTAYTKNPRPVKPADSRHRPTDPGSPHQQIPPR